MSKSPDEKLAEAQVGDLDDLHAKYDKVQLVNALPTQWRDKAGATHLAGKPTPVIAPTGEDVVAFSGTQLNTCGHCRYFDLESGRKEILRQRFGEKLVSEYEWKLRYLGPLDSVGLCGASGGELAVTHLSRACDQFRRRT
jgi:hypothetical protein